MVKWVQGKKELWEKLVEWKQTCHAIKVVFRPLGMTLRNCQILWRRQSPYGTGVQQTSHFHLQGLVAWKRRSICHPAFDHFCWKETWSSGHYPHAPRCPWHQFFPAIIVSAYRMPWRQISLSGSGGNRVTNNRLAFREKCHPTGL